MDMKRISLAVAVVLALFGVSCSDDDESDDGGTGGTAGSAGSAGGTGGSSGTGGSAGSGGTAGTATGGSAGAAGAGGSAGGTTDAQCHAMTAPQCRQCCGDGHGDGQQAYDAAYTDCVCQATTCASQCQQSVCATPANPGPTPSCNDCLGNVTDANGACAPATVEAACTDAACAAFIACLSGCPN